MVKKSSFKYFIGYNNNDDIRPLCINHLQMTECAKYFEVIRLCLLRSVIKKLLRKYIKIWEKISSLIN